MGVLIRIAESGSLPDVLVRLGIRRLLRRRLHGERNRERSGSAAAPAPGASPLAIETDRANEQHYELPAEFFRLILGSRLKYSCCLWESDGDGLDGAEERMLGLTCERAGIRDGARVLDLGSGWGSLGLWIAERFPACRVSTVSNSESQQCFIRDQATRRGLANVETIHADINRFCPSATYDRIVSVEMFEHVRDHAALLARISRWLRPGGALFVHLFCHRALAYPYENEGDDDWMARHFFTGGMMPSLDLLDGIDGDLRVTRRWKIPGTHYERTLRAWLQRLDDRREAAMEILAAHYGADRARLWFVRWRLFLLACAELFGFRGGTEWLVGHFLLENREAS